MRYVEELTYVLSINICCTGDGKRAEYSEVQLQTTHNSALGDGLSAPRPNRFISW
jgi:hypothetical protein